MNTRSTWPPRECHHFRRPIVCQDSRGAGGLLTSSARAAMEPQINGQLRRINQFPVGAEPASRGRLLIK